MTASAERLKDRFYGNEAHPYQRLEHLVGGLLQNDHALLDAGCGRTAPALRKFVGRASRLIGVDLVEFAVNDPSLELIRCDLSDIPLEDATVDIVMSRSTMEHVEDPAAVYGQIHRILRPGGFFVFLTPNFWDYASLAAHAVPNRLHPWIVARTEGRAEHDVFPTQYKTNTNRAVRRWAARTGFDVLAFDYLGQYPNYFMFNGFLFFLATGYEKLTSRFEALRFLRGWILVTLRKQ